MKTKCKNYAGGPLMAVDALGRGTPDVEHGAPSTRKDRLVGLFYFLWLGSSHHRPYNVTEMLEQDPDIGHKPTSPLWGGKGVYHHWGEPFYGYYYSNDEWVVRKHMKLLMQADIDFLFFDTTNGPIYADNARLVMKVLQEYHDEGWKIPRVMFYTNTASGDTVQRIYDAVYREGYCKDTWFCLDGKPVIIAKEECSPETCAFFNIKMSQWPNEPDKLGGWPWMDFTRPQRVFANLKGEPEVINVSVAQHPQIKFGDSALYGEKANCGRAYHNGENDPTPGAWKYGYNFAEQFDRALETDPPIVLVTGWNEWIAGDWGSGRGERPICFVDCANAEYSRDIEMMRGGYFDNYFMQLVSYVRRYKGAEATPVYSPVATVDMPVAESMAASPARYDGFSDGGFNRHAVGQGGVIYTNYTQRNVIEEIGVKHDAKTISFTVRTKELLSDPLGAGSWMKIYLNTVGGEGYQYVLNHTTCRGGKTTLAKVIGKGDDLTAVNMEGVDIRYEIEGHLLRINLPRSAVGLDYGYFNMWFKVADSREAYKSVEDFYDKGDAVPLGRLNFVYHGE